MRTGTLLFRTPDPHTDPHHGGQPLPDCPIFPHLNGASMPADQLSQCFSAWTAWVRTLLLIWTATSGACLADEPAAALPAPADQAAPSFRNDVMAVLSRSGCSLGTCHGNQLGKGGLKLSLRGQDPDADFRTLTRELAGRRVNPLLPDSSLLLQKPLMQVPHEGGRRFQVDSQPHQILRRWIAAGLPADAPDAPRLQALEVTPQQLTIYAPILSAQITVTARFSDGSHRDVTQLAVLESSAPFVSISPTGLVSTERSGLTTVTVRYLDQQVPVRLEFVPEIPDFVFQAPPVANAIDEVVFRQLQRLRMNPAPLSDDTTFLRRVYLDVTGLLPPADKARAFLASTAPDKRAVLIDELLASPEYVDYQTLRWADLLRVEEKTLDQKGLQVYHNWIREAVARDQPLNEFVRDIIAARGSTYTVPAANFYRALRNPEERAESTAQLFLGIRLQCTKCHNHPFDRWTQADYYGWSGFFARIDYQIIENKRRDENDKHEFAGEQIVVIKDEGEVQNPATGQPAPLRFLGDSRAAGPDNAAATDTPAPDRLQQLAEWISAADNQRFAATQANRLWFQLLGRGVVDPVDDFRSTNPPSNPELLNLLQQEFVSHQFSTRHLLRLILNSSVYQLSSAQASPHDDEAACFSWTVPRRLTAEQTLDAIAAVTGSTPTFGGHPAGVRAVQLVGVRNGGHRFSPPETGDRFLQLFGKPDRLQTCECERSEETTLAQTFELVSGEVVQQLLKHDSGRIAVSVSSDRSTEDILQDLYWTALTRPPSATEQQALTDYVNARPDRRTALEDIAWAVMNSHEFLLRR